MTKGKGRFWDHFVLTKPVSEDGHVVPMKSDYRSKYGTWAFNDINDDNSNILLQLDNS